MEEKSLFNHEKGRHVLFVTKTKQTNTIISLSHALNGKLIDPNFLFDSLTCDQSNLDAIA
jgi:hypothetical protein